MSCPIISGSSFIAICPVWWVFCGGLSVITISFRSAGHTTYSDGQM